MNTGKGSCCQDVLSLEDEGVLRIEKANGQFRILTQHIRTEWLPDIAQNRKVMLIFLRLCCNKADKPLYTHSELSAIVGSENRQASSNHMEHFCACARDMLAFLRRKRKVDEQVVDALIVEILKDPLVVDLSKCCEAVNKSLNRDDLSEENIQEALKQVSYASVRKILLEKLSNGEANYKEKYLFEEMRTLYMEAGKRAGIAANYNEGMTVSDPTAIRSLFIPNSDEPKPKRLRVHGWRN